MYIPGPTLEELMEKLAKYSPDNPDCLKCASECYEYLDELRQWRENPFKKMSEVCREKPSCKACDYDEFCCGKSNIPVPEEWKF